MGGLHLRGTPLQVERGPSFRGTIASLADTFPFQSRPDYRITVRWGDGTSSSAGLRRVGRGAFDVIGSHRYRRVGRYTVSVGIADLFERTAVTHMTVLAGVLLPPLNPRPS